MQWGRYPYHHDTVNILEMEVNSKLCLGSHLESLTRKASLRVILLGRVRDLLDADSLMKLCMAQVISNMEYSPLIWMSRAQGHLSLLDQVQRTAEHLISNTYNSNHIAGTI